MREWIFVVMAAAAVSVAAPVAATAAPVKLAQLDVHIDRDHDRDYRAYDRDDRYFRHRHGCRTVTIREHHDGRVVVRKIRRCD